MERDAPNAILDHDDDHDEDRVRVMLVDDHVMVVDSLRRAIDEEPDLRTVAVAHSVAEALTVIGRQRVDVALLDRRLPDGDGIELGKALRDASPGLSLLLLTGDPITRTFEAALDAGFCGTLEKAGQLDRLLQAVRDASVGRAVVSVADLARLRRTPAHATSDELTGREIEILRYMAQALAYKEIATRAFLSVNTVRKHVQSILRKLGAHSKLECILIARERGLVELE